MLSQGRSSFIIIVYLFSSQAFMAVGQLPTWWWWWWWWVCVRVSTDAFTIMVPEENQTFPVSGVSDDTIMGLYWSCVHLTVLLWSYICSTETRHEFLKTWAAWIIETQERWNFTSVACVCYLAGGKTSLVQNANKTSFNKALFTAGIL